MLQTFQMALVSLQKLEEIKITTATMHNSFNTLYSFFCVCILYKIDSSFSIYLFFQTTSFKSANEINYVLCIYLIIILNFRKKTNSF